MGIRKVLFAVGLLLMVTIRSASAREAAYFFVGWLNDWSTTDHTYPLTPLSDGLTWEITLPAAGDGCWFKIAPASAYGQQDFWHLLLCTPYDGCRELTGRCRGTAKGLGCCLTSQALIPIRLG